MGHYLITTDGTDWRKPTYAEVKAAFLADAQRNSATYKTGSQTLYDNLPDGLVETAPQDGDEVTVDNNSELYALMGNGFSAVGTQFKDSDSTNG